MKESRAALLIFLLTACASPDEPTSEKRSRRPASSDAGVGLDSGLPDAASSSCTCDPLADCIGGVCRCRAGYEGDGTTCTDVDECATGQFQCPAGSSCENNVGDYDCFCLPGFRPSGDSCEPIDCGHCDVNFGCGSGASCGQRYCDGRFACSQDGACGTVGGFACTTSSAWETCASQDDCPASIDRANHDQLRFVCVALSWDSSVSASSRCWPVIRWAYSQVEPPPPDMPLECPPVPQGSTADILLGPDSVGVYEWEPPPQEGNPHASSYQACYLACAAGDTCPFDMVCRAGRCQ